MADTTKFIDRAQLLIIHAPYVKHLKELEKQDTFFSPGKLYEGLTEIFEFLPFLSLRGA